MSLSFLLPDFGLSFKQSPCLTYKNEEKYHCFTQAGTGPHPKRDESNFRKKETYPSLQSQSRDGQSLLSVWQKHFQVQKWRSSMKRSGEIPGGGRREPLWQRYKEVNISFQILWASWDRSTVLSIQHEAIAMEPGKPLNGADVRGSLGSEREPGPCHPTSGWQQASHTWGKVAGPKSVLGGKLGHEIPCKTQNFYEPPFPHLENNDPIPLTRWAARR